MGILMRLLILHIALKLTCSDDHQHEQNDEDNAQPLRRVKNATPAERPINARVTGQIAIAVR